MVSQVVACYEPNKTPMVVVVMMMMMMMMMDLRILVCACFPIP